MGKRQDEWQSSEASTEQLSEEHNRHGDTRRSRRRLLTIVISIAAPLIGVLSFVIPLLASQGERESAADTLEIVKAAPVEVGQAGDNTALSMQVIGEQEQFSKAELAEIIGLGMITNWLIPVSAPIETFPVNDELQCDGPVLEWLLSHATVTDIQDRLFSGFTPAMLRNNSTSIAALSLGNVRFDGEPKTAEPAVRFTCLPQQTGGPVAFQPIQIRPNGEPGVMGPNPFGVEMPEQQPVGMLAVLNIAAGESLFVTFEAVDFDAEFAYEGRVLADVMDESGSSVILVDQLRIERPAIPGFVVTLDVQARSFACGRYDPAEEFPFPLYSECTPQEASSLLAEAAVAAG
ncbi:hypothetical protein QF046_002955 [Microbacterium sp. W4I4]|uniref:hypothetical protein n=1 Tax=Microbacterium sp. W4I4 TaxID=3042295 RepID=UPI002783EDF3|nr:hypothetical protein [Microbacterium sp. W4I4]MDQ0615314.1 hypothetical protein [Microbacterium sp. W4I4]